MERGMTYLGVILKEEFGSERKEWYCNCMVKTSVVMLKKAIKVMSKFRAELVFKIVMEKVRVW